MRGGGPEGPRPQRPAEERRPSPASDARPQASKPGERRRIVETYPYHDEEGVLRYEVVRYEPKTFTQRRPVVAGSTSGPWIWGLKGQEYFRRPGRADWYPRRPRDDRPAEEIAEFPEEERLLYRLGDVLNAVEDGETIHVVEGEKDVHALKALGLVATCNSGGSGKWGPEFSAQLTGADVVVFADNDEAGDAHADEVCRSLRGRAKRVRRVDLPGLPPKGDVADFLAAGGDLDAIRAAVAAAREWLPELPVAPFPVVRFGDMREYRPFDEWLVRNWIGRGQLVAVYGPPKQGKSFLTIDLGARIAHGWPWFGLPTQRSVVIYNAAEGGEGVKKRLAAWANAPGRSVDPFAPFFMVPTVLDLFSDETAADALIAYARAVSDALGAPVGAIFIDTLARAMVGGDENSAVDMGRLIAAADRIKTATGATVILVHHSGKDVGRGMRGHSSLLGAVDGAISVA
ncbi:MAG: AAA family ATPase, partial [Pseudomonadota bacterium]|nr:AAA family ATPase [Pseudomonadota bacterium]